MRILVISDTHGNFPLVVEACETHKPFDVIFHLGDGSNDVALLQHVSTAECIHVAGNCDIGSRAPRELVWEGAGKKILLTHGDLYGVKNGLNRLFMRTREVEADAVLFGHTHLAMTETVNGILLLNPGTLTKATHYHSCATLEILPDGTFMVKHHKMP